MSVALEMKRPIAVALCLVLLSGLLVVAGLGLRTVPPADWRPAITPMPDSGVYGGSSEEVHTRQLADGSIRTCRRALHPDLGPGPWDCQRGPAGADVTTRSPSGIPSEPSEADRALPRRAASNEHGPRRPRAGPVEGPVWRHLEAPRATSRRARGVANAQPAPARREAPAPTVGPTDSVLVDTQRTRRTRARREPLSDRLHREHARAVDGLRRGMRTSPVNDEIVRQVEDAEAAREPEIARSMTRPSAAVLVLRGPDHTRPTLATETFHRPSGRCLHRAGRGDLAPSPASLACLRTIVRTERFSSDGVATAMDVLTMLTSFPLWGRLKQLRSRGVAQEQVSRLLWAQGWLRWVQRNPRRLRATLNRLSSVERRALRRTLARWWHKSAYAEYHRLVNRIMGRHFVALVPRCGDRHGLPLRRCFSTARQWVSNWDAASRRLPANVVERARANLPPAQVAELAALSTRS